MKRALLCLLALLLFVSSLNAQTVLQHKRLGNDVEAMAYVDNGPYAGHIAILDGMQVIGFSADGRGNSQPHTLFNLSKLPLPGQPFGMGYDSDDQLFIFALNSTFGPTATFYLMDHLGNLVKTIDVPLPGDFANNTFVDGIGWIPKDAPRYPGTFVFSAEGLENHFFVADIDGNFVADIVPAVDQNSTNFEVTGLTYAHGELIAGDTDNHVWKFDLDGNITAGPVFFPDVLDVEGVAYAERSDRIAITSYNSGKLVFLDNALNRLPEERSFVAGLGLSKVTDVAWSPDSSEFVVTATSLQPTLAGVSVDLATSHTILDLGSFPIAPSRLDYLPDAHEIALFRRSPLPRGFDYVDLNGNETGFDAISTSFVPSAFTYIPTTQQYAVRRSSPASTLFILDKNNLLGSAVRSIDLAPLGVVSIRDVAYAHPEDPTGGQFLVATDNNLFLIDFNGNLIAKYDNPMHVTSLGAISSGLYAGAYAGIYTANDELFIFNLP